MIKQKSTLKGIFKGAAIGFAFIMCTAFFPIKALANVYADWKEGDKATIANSISVDAKTVTVTKGETVTIPDGVYHYVPTKAQATENGECTHTIGKDTDCSDVDEGIKSYVEVFYKDTNDVIKTAQDAATTFVASRVGRYTITYTVEHNGMIYTYDLVVVSQVSDVTFDFTTNDKNIIPAHYDPAYVKEQQKKQGLNWNNGDIVLPLPVVKDDDGNEVLDGTDVSKYKAGTLSEVNEVGDYFVQISLSSSGGQLSIKEIKDGENKVTGYKLAAEDLEKLDGQQISVIYSYYEVKGDTKIFVSSTSKTFTVSNGYYHKVANSQKEADIGYDLQTSWSSSTTDLSAVVGVRKELPSITATTSSTNDPANEKVDIWYSIDVKKQGQAAEGLIEENKYFTAQEEGTYNFTYNVYDFYGNTIASTKTNFDIKNVKDTLSANVYVYDAGETDAFDEEKNEYKSALSMLKSQTDNRNIIMYAVGGTDNKKSNNDKLTLKRVIRDNTGVDMFKVTEEKYHGYNLIFAPGVAENGETEETTTNGVKYPSLYTQIATDNYHIQRQMKLENKDPSKADDIVSFLKSHKYLLVTTQFNKDWKGSEIFAGNSYAEGSQEAINEMMKGDDHNLGYAYIKPENENRKTFTNGTYTFIYGAKDPDNSETTQRYSVIVTSGYTDASIPTISFDTDLQAAYLKDDTITFNVASATDETSQDSRLDTLTAYRFLKTKDDANKKDLNGGKLVPEKGQDDFKKLKYFITNAKEGLLQDEDTSNGVWYAKKGELIESDGWYYDETKSSYSINLANAPEGAEYVQILAYAIDDYGNAGFFNKLIKIANSEDTKAPTLCRIANYKTDPEQKYEAPTDIILPTLTYEDDGVEYMSAHVAVNQLIYSTEKDQTDKIVGKDLIQSIDMETSFDSIRGIFTVKAGSFKAPLKGTYQVAVTVTDAGNHTITTYFTYNVDGEDVDDIPQIDNITSETQNLKPGQQYYLVPPTLSFTESDGYKYIGFEEGDDQHTSTYYTVSVVSATADYKLDKYYFKAYKAGTFELQYKVFMIRYKETALKTNGDASEGELFFKTENGRQGLAYKNSSKEYYLYMEESKNADGEVEYVLKGNTKLNGTGDDLDSNTIKTLTDNKTVSVYSCLSKVQTITVGGVEINVSIDENYYAKTYSEVGHKITIIKPDNIQYNGEGYETNLAESKVTISRRLGNTTTSIGTLTFDKWAEDITNNSETLFRSSDGEAQAEEGDKAVLYLRDNGTYSITYSIQAMDNTGTNVGEPKVVEYTITNGDITPPTLNLYKDDKSVVKARYNIGDSMTINFAAIEVKDNYVVENSENPEQAINTKEKLLENLTVEIRNKDLDGSNYTLLDNTSTVDGEYAYTYDLNTAGTYELRFTLKDAAGNSTEKSITFEVSAEEKKSVDVKEVMGGVLIGISCAILAGVVIYFVVSKVRLDKKEKQYKDK